MAIFVIKVKISAMGRIFRPPKRHRTPDEHKIEETLRHVATFASESGKGMSCHVVTFARNLETYDINICLGPDDIYAYPKRAHAERDVQGAARCGGGG